MNITGKVKLYVERKELSDGRDFLTFTCAIISKVKDTDKYISRNIDLVFSAENFPSEKLRELKEDRVYDLELVEAWLKVRAYNDKEGKEKTALYLFVNKATLTGSKKIKQDDDDLPF